MPRTVRGLLFPFLDARPVSRLGGARMLREALAALATIAATVAAGAVFFTIAEAQTPTPPPVDTYIWTPCVDIRWAPASGAVVGYHLDDTSGTLRDVTATEAEACISSTDTPVTFFVRAFDAEGVTGPWSDPLTVARVHNFDSDGDGLVGFPDFGQCIGQYGWEYGETGIVTKGAGR
jgi:hypothetical protein